MRLPTLALLILSGACAPDLTPARLTDTLWVEPDDAGARAFVTWNVYGPGFARRGNDRHHACAIVQSLELVEDASGCEGCEVAWSVAAVDTIETDCEGFTLPAQAEVQGVALGDLDSELSGEEPWPEADQGSWVRYGDGGWVPHGWALPDGPGEAVWDGEHAVTAWPAWAVVVQ